jgi:TPR repeat protein
MRRLRRASAATVAVFLTALPFTALAVLAPRSETKSAETEERARAIAAAVAACETGASFPFDRRAVAPAIQFPELLPADFNIAPLEALIRACATAREAHPDDDRLRLMALRAEAAHFGTRLDRLVPPIRTLSLKGDAEADYLLYALHRSPLQDGEPDGHGIAREEAVAGLRRAASAGHQQALIALLEEERQGPLLRRDPAGAIATARKLEALPPQGPRGGVTEADARDLGASSLATLILTTPGLDTATYVEGYRRLTAIRTAEPDALEWPLAAALLHGRGTAMDPAAARRLLEAAVAAGRFQGAGLLAAMLVAGEGGPADGKAAIALLSDPKARFAPGAASLLATLLTDNRFVGPDPNRAALTLAGSVDIDDAIRAVPLMADYRTPLPRAAVYLQRLEDAATAGEPGAARALAELRLSGHPAFRDETAGRAILIRLAASGDGDAAWRVAETQYDNLDGSSGRPFRRDDGGLSDDAIRTLIDRGAAAKDPRAYLLHAKLMRRGAIYRQDDKAATNALISAANLGSVEAMVLLGDAYDNGLGIAEDPRERLRAWREAAKLGSLAAREKIASAFTFDTFDKLITLREGVSERVALHNNDLSGQLPGLSATMAFAGLFQGGRAADAGTAAMAGAVLDGFRLGPAGLEEDALVETMRALPEEIRLAMEAALVQQGFLKRAADGSFGPDARDALRAFVEAKGPLPDTATLPAAASAGAGDLDPATLARARDRIYAAVKSVKSKEDRTTAIRGLNSLARYGDPSARWAILVNYDDADFVRNNVTPAELTRYGLDILVARPPGMEKPDFEFVFALGMMLSAGEMGSFGTATLDAIRDDPRLQDPLALGGVLQALVFAPGACDAILEAARQSQVAGLGAEGCDEATKAALIGFAHVAGPSGVAASERKAGAAELTAIAGRP